MWLLLGVGIWESEIIEGFSKTLEGGGHESPLPPCTKLYLQ